MRVAVLLIVALTCACHREPTFDERYEQAREKIGRTAGEIDQELKRREQQAKEREPDSAKSAPDGPPGKAIRGSTHP